MPASFMFAKIAIGIAAVLGVCMLAAFAISVGLVVGGLILGGWCIYKSIKMNNDEMRGDNACQYNDDTPSYHKEPQRRWRFSFLKKKEKKLRLGPDGRNLDYKLSCGASGSPCVDPLEEQFYMKSSHDEAKRLKTLKK